MPRGEAWVERQIREEYAEEDAKREEEARRKRAEYEYQCEEYRHKNPAPEFYDAQNGDGPRPEIYPVIIAQVGGLVHVLRWTGWAGAYAVTSIARERYVHPDTIRFWLPMPQPVDPPEDFYGKD